MLSHWMRFQHPFRAMDEISRELARLQEWPTATPLARSEFHGTYAPMTLTDEGDAFVLHAELPGATTEDLKLSIEGDLVTVGARRRSSAPEGYKVLRKGRADLAFERSFRVPAAIDADHVSASLRDGVLRVELPKAASAKPRQIPISAT